MNITAQSGLHPRANPADAGAKPALTCGRADSVRDSMKTRHVLLRFSAISLITAAVDNLTFYLVFRATGTIAGAQIAARAVSVLFNYRAVHRAVFLSHQRHRAVFPRYLALVCINALISYGGIRSLISVTSLGVLPSKILIETLLFIANFTAQRLAIFSRRPPGNDISRP